MIKDQRSWIFPARMQARFGKGRMVIPKPLDVDALIRRVPKGKLVTMLQLRQELARRSKVDVACPLCTGIFVRIAAEAAEEERRAGKKTVTPYWRVISRRSAQSKVSRWAYFAKADALRRRP